MLRFDRVLLPGLLGSRSLSLSLYMYVYTDGQAKQIAEGVLGQLGQRGALITVLQIASASAPEPSANLTPTALI